MEARRDHPTPPQTKGPSTFVNCYENIQFNRIWVFVALAYQGKDIAVFRFILEYIVA
jgi:hypothetical protein